ncbi:MAG: hypothetical protein WC146_00620 [Patescibacteria group bacterium]|jgi:hypothetical protein
MKYKRFIPLLIPFLVWFLNQAFLSNPEFFYSSLGLGVLIIILGIKLFANSHSAKDWIPFIVAPILFFLSFSGYATIIVGDSWIQAIFVLIACFLFFYFRTLYYYFISDNTDWTERLDNLLSMSGFLSIFAAAGLLFGLPAFLNWSPIVTIIIFIPFIWLLFVQFLPIKKIKLVSTSPILISVALILAEFAWVFSFWPLNFNILALFLAITYYLLLTITRLYWDGRLNRRSLRLPFALSIGIFIILILTARWL